MCSTVLSLDWVGSTKAVMWIGVEVKESCEWDIKEWSESDAVETNVKDSIS